MTRNLGKTFLLLAFAAAPMAAQSSTYTVPGGLGEERQNRRDAVRRAYQNARWQIGFLHLDPRLAITDIGYVSNIYNSADEGAESDFKAQGAAGLRGFFNLGPKVLVSPFVDIAHTWWKEQDQLRSSHGSFGVQLFGDFNRLQLQIEGGRVETQRNLSSELEVPVDIQNDRLEVRLDVDFWGPFRFFANAADDRGRQSSQAAEDRLPGLDLSLLDVDNELVNAGFAYELANGLSVGLGFEETETTFLNDPGGRSNRGSGPLLRVAFEGNRMTIDVEVAQRDLEFAARETEDKRDQVIGFGQLGFQLSERLTATFYGGTRLDASALDSAAIFEGRRSGLNLRRQTSPRARITAFYEAGRDEFATVASDQVTRVDDFTSYGVNLTFQPGERLTLEVGFLDSRRDSSDPELDRDVRSLVSRVRLGGDLLTW